MLGCGCGCGGAAGGCTEGARGWRLAGATGGRSTRSILSGLSDRSGLSGRSGFSDLSALSGLSALSNRSALSGRSALSARSGRSDKSAEFDPFVIKGRVERTFTRRPISVWLGFITRVLK